MPVVAVTEVQGSWDPAAIVDEALAQLVQLGQGVFTAGIWLVIVGLPLLLVGLVIVRGRRVRRPSARARPPAGATDRGECQHLEHLHSRVTSP